MQEDTTAIRRHIRHVTGIPVEITLDFNSRYHTEEDEITNVSLGGMCFIANDRLDISDEIQVKFPALKQNETINGKVVWCTKVKQGYEVGLEFEDPEEVDRLKTVDQICQVENFRKEKERLEGRQLSSEQAASEWISQITGNFSALN